MLELLTAEISSGENLSHRNVGGFGLSPSFIDKKTRTGSSFLYLYFIREDVSHFTGPLVKVWFWHLFTFFVLSFLRLKLFYSIKNVFHGLLAVLLPKVTNQDIQLSNAIKIRDALSGKCQLLCGWANQQSADLLPVLQNRKPDERQQFKVCNCRFMDVVLKVILIFYNLTSPLEESHLNTSHGWFCCF